MNPRGRPWSRDEARAAARTRWAAGHWRAPRTPRPRADPALRRARLRVALRAYWARSPERRATLQQARRVWCRAHPEWLAPFHMALARTRAQRAAAAVARIERVYMAALAIIRRRAKKSI